MSTKINYDELSDIESERMYEEAMKPYWAERLVKEDENGYIATGAVLPTKDGRKHGNATVISVVNDIKNFVRIITVMTDEGNMIRMTDEEIEQGFYPPKYIRKQGVIVPYRVCIEHISEDGIGFVKYPNIKRVDIQDDDTMLIVIDEKDV